MGRHSMPDDPEDSVDAPSEENPECPDQYAAEDPHPDYDTGRHGTPGEPDGVFSYPQAEFPPRTQGQYPGESQYPDESHYRDQSHYQDSYFGDDPYAAQARFGARGDDFADEPHDLAGETDAGHFGAGGEPYYAEGFASTGADEYPEFPPRAGGGGDEPPKPPSLLRGGHRV